LTFVRSPQNHSGDELVVELSAIPDAMIALDQDGHIIFANPQAEAMFGARSGNLTGQTLDLLLPERFRGAHRNHVKNYLLAPSVRFMDRGLKLIGLRRDGTEFPVEVKLSPASASGQSIVLAAIRDIAEQEAAKEKAHHSEQLISTLINGISGYAVYLLDTEGRILTWHAGAEAIKGYRADEVLGKDLSIFFTQTDREAGIPQKILHQARESTQTNYEAVQVRKDGSLFFAQVTIAPIRDAAGCLIGFSKLTRDITEQRNSEDLAKEALRLAQEAALQRNLSEERERASLAYRKTSETLTAVIEASPIGIFTIDRHQQIEIWNSACEAIFGYPSTAVVGMSVEKFRRLVRGSDAALDASHASDRQTEWEREIRRKDGSIALVRFSFAPTALDAVGPGGGIFLIVDVTERKSLEEQLRQAQKMEALGQLTGGIAHDFNNLLSIIICNIELLMADFPSQSDAAESGQMALDASLRGAALIQQMLTFARKQRLEPEVVQVNGLVGSMTSMLKRTLGDHIEIILNMAPDAGTSLLDAARLQTALANLATNARDLMPSGGRLVIETTNVTLDEDYIQVCPDATAGDYVLIAVSDTGGGMSRETAARAFDPFFTTKPEGFGTGLGLSMVFGFVKQSAGHIRIYSELGRGTTVRLYVPRVTPVNASPQTIIALSPKRLSGTILVVEDNADLARSVNNMLRQSGLVTLVVHNADEALRVIESGAAIDLLFTDIILSTGMHGLELATAATKLRPDLKVLFTTGFSETTLTASGQKVISERMLGKPYRRAELLAKLAALLE